MTDTRLAKEGKPEGDLLVWILIISELVVFGAGIVLLLIIRLSDPQGFAAAQDQLDRVGAGINAILLITSGYLAARALQFASDGLRSKARLHLIAAAVLGVGFLWLKGLEYADKAAHGISAETHPFFMFYFLLTGFHAAHVVAGLVILLLLCWRCDPDQMEDGIAFWHMVDLVWVLIFPVIYVLR